MANTSTTEGRLFFIGLRSLEKLEIQFVPSKLTINRDPTVQEVEIVGLNLPRTQHQGGKRTLSLELDFYSNAQSREDVIRKCRWLESLTYRGGPGVPAEQVRLVYGAMFQNEIWNVQRVQYDLSLFDKKFGFLPRQAYVTVVLVQDGDLEPTARSVRDI